MDVSPEERTICNYINISSIETEIKKRLKQILYINSRRTLCVCVCVCVCVCSVLFR